jgi:hypothetical protein
MLNSSLKCVVRAGLALLLFISGCATSPSGGNSVGETLKSYQVGKTTFRDFKRDARLTFEVRTVDNPNARRSYLHPNSQPKKITREGWVVSPGSPWKIYETGNYWFYGTGPEGKKSVDERSYVVGDTKRPMMILTFEGETTLKKMTPVR